MPSNLTVCPTSLTTNSPESVCAKGQDANTRSASSLTLPLPFRGHDLYRPLVLPPLVTSRFTSTSEKKEEDIHLPGQLACYQFQPVALTPTSAI